MDARPMAALVGWLARTAQRLRADRHVVATARTMSGTARVVDTHDGDGRPVRVLEVDGTWQSATYLDEGWAELAFPYHRRFDDALDASGRPWTSALMLGGGGYAFPKYLVSHYPTAMVDVVEIDPAVTELAERYFLLDRCEGLFGAGKEGRLRTFNLEGRRFLEGTRGRDAYDVILNDCFMAEHPAASLATAEGVRAIRRRLAPGGLYLSNVVSALEGRRSQVVRDVVATLAEQFSHVAVIPLGPEDPTLEDNNVVAASDDALDLPGTWTLSARPAGRVLHDGRE